MKKLALISTGIGVVEPIKAIVKELSPNIEIINIVDDSIVNCIAENHNDISPSIIRRMALYAMLAEEHKADAAIVTCSSISETVDKIAPLVNIPVFKIDQPMAQHAVSVGKTIGVAATLATTLEPTKRLILSEAKNIGKAIEIKESLCKGAFESLIQGNPETHDSIVRTAVLELLETCNVVVLAQASMARAVDTLEENRDRVLTSPKLGVTRAVDYLEDKQEAFL